MRTRRTSTLLLLVLSSVVLASACKDGGGATGASEPAGAGAPVAVASPADGDSAGAAAGQDGGQGTGAAADGGGQQGAGRTPDGGQGGGGGGSRAGVAPPSTHNTIQLGPQFASGEGVLISFGTVAPGTTAERDIAIENMSPSDLTVIEVLHGPYVTLDRTSTAIGFSISQDGCTGTVLKTGESCTVRVAFRADSTEEQEAFLNARASPSTGSQDAHLVANAGRTSPRGNTEATEGTSGTTTTDTGSTTTSDTSSTSDPEPTTTSDNSSGTTS